MENIRTFFFDTYAFFEIINENQNYKKYAQDVVIVTTKLNLMELHYGLLLKLGKTIADLHFDEFSKYVVAIDDETIKKANEFRVFFKDRDFSYIDCIGYTLAKTIGIKFLTGDRQFEDLENVEFVK